MTYIDQLIHFLDHSPVNFLAIKTTAELLEAKGYRRLDASLPIKGIEAGTKCYFTKNDSSIYAFHVGSQPLAEAGFHVICAHCDSPTFRIKPNAEITCEPAGVPCQRFVNHSDVAGGSTLGNILASSIPLRGVDMGNPILAMHSIRETGACIDHDYCIKAFKQFYK